MKPIFSILFLIPCFFFTSQAEGPKITNSLSMMNHLTTIVGQDKLCTFSKNFTELNYLVVPKPDSYRQTDKVIITIKTGGDDLRGRNDNVDLEVVLRTGNIITFKNINKSARWTNFSVNSFEFVPDFDPDLITGILLKTHFRGGMSGDNWNVDKVKVFSFKSGIRKTLLDVSGAPIVRFSGTVHHYIFPIRR